MNDNSIVILPIEILNLILFEFIDNIEFKIFFKKIGKLNIKNFQNIENLLESTTRTFSLFNVTENRI